MRLGTYGSARPGSRETVKGRKVLWIRHTDTGGLGITLEPIGSQLQIMKQRLLVDTRETELGSELMRLITIR